MDDFNKNIIDTEFEEIDNTLIKDKDISKEPLYYSRIQVAKILEEKESTISYWSKEFQPILKLKIVNMNRKYTKKDVENLLFIKKLIREDGLMIKQVLDYCQKKGFNEEGLLDTSNPLAVKTFVSAMTDEFDKKVSEMQNQIIIQQQEMIEQLKNLIIQNNQDVKKELSLTVDEVVTEKFNDLIKQSYKSFTNIETQITKQTNKMQESLDKIATSQENRDIQISNNYKELLKQRREEIEKNKDQEEKQGFLSKIFTRKK